MRWAGHVAQLGDKVNTIDYWCEDQRERDHQEDQNRRWLDNIGMDLGEVGWGDEDWSGLAQDRNRWRALVNSVLNLRVP
jgi:hypothetical protein